MTLPRGTDIEHFVDLIRWVYAGVFRTPTEQLLSVVALAQEFAMESALEVRPATRPGFLKLGVSLRLGLTCAQLREELSGLKVAQRDTSSRLTLIW